MRHIFPALLGVLFVFLVAVIVLEIDLVQQSASPTQPEFSELQDRQLARITVSHPDVADDIEKTLEVEIVNSSRSRAQGLSGRTEIGADGMLFLFPEAREQYFWMKDMQFNIDIVWILDGEVISVSRNVEKPQEDTSDNKLETYPSGSPANMVLEVHAGDTDIFGLQPGATIHLVQ